MARTLSFGIVEERAVFMDERTDSYFTLDPVGEDFLHRKLEAAEPLGGAEMLGLLGVGDEAAEVVRAAYAAPSKSLLDQHSPGCPSATHIIKAAILVRSTASHLRTGPIETVLRNAVAVKGHAPARQLQREEMILQAARFLKARRLVPFKRNCLLDSLSLLRWLGIHRSAVALLFGVKLDPFAAHCWVQAGTLVLNDRIETVAAFNPVRVIECSEATR
jgi:hypothetical protein